MARTAKTEDASSKRRVASPASLPPGGRRDVDEERRARGPRRALLAGSSLLLVGLAMVGVDSSTEGAALTLLGILILIYGIHRFGRLGPDEAALRGRAGT
jgi:hypothetical protein